MAFACQGTGLGCQESGEDEAEEESKCEARAAKVIEAGRLRV